MTSNKRFEISSEPNWDKGYLVSLNDTHEQVVIVMDKDQLEALIEWWCKTFDRILV